MRSTSSLADMIRMPRLERRPRAPGDNRLYAETPSRVDPFSAAQRTEVIYQGIARCLRQHEYAGVESFAPLDPDKFITYARPAALFLQLARYDQYVPTADALHYQQIAPFPKRIRWYNADHMLNAQAQHDREVWFNRQLNLH